MSEYHIPVLLKECVEGLNIKDEGVYVDLTFGGGGHSIEILKHLGKESKLIVFDQDEDARRNALDDHRFEFVKSNFRHLKRQLKYLGVQKVDGVLADLGVSSFQFDEGPKGFSYRRSEELDMRMNQNQKITAAQILNVYSEESLARMFWVYGNIKSSRKLARVIVEERDRVSFGKVEHFLNVMQKLTFGKHEKFWSKVFQALRIEVNDEMGALKEVLKDLPSIMNHKGRVVVMSYHSLEDRLVKRFFKTGNLEGKIVQDAFGNVQTPFRLVNRKIIVPDEDEMNENVRSRSAKLRIAEFISSEY